MKPIILLSNDDGITAPGLKSLYDELIDLGELWVAAPETAQSAQGRAITLTRPLRVVELSERWFMVDGTPSDCVNLAINTLLPRSPDLVISGINLGPNLADDISYSGTVAAAFEAAIKAIPACAVSLATRSNANYGPAARFTARLARNLLSNGLPTDTLLNINVPAQVQREPLSYRLTSQGKSIYEKKITRVQDPRSQTYYWIGGKEVDFEKIDGSDAAAVAAGHVSITPLSTNLTNSAVLNELQNLVL
ncbi:MAG: 5'/3'-nucleotidase SurE [Deltaproteobacteria bacterium]|nr:5'/3'-nucleotidase SurE [Deltaproteobacteria bacterium]